MPNKLEKCVPYWLLLSHAFDEALKYLIMNLIFMQYLYRSISQTGWVFANGPGDRGSIPGRVIPKTQKWYLMPPCIIRYGSKITWVIKRKGVASSPTPHCSSYRKENHRVTLVYGQTSQVGLRVGYLYTKILNQNQIVFSFFSFCKLKHYLQKNVAAKHG